MQPTLLNVAANAGQWGYLNNTLLSNNYAPTGSNIQNNGRLFMLLPLPLGHYVTGAFKCRELMCVGRPCDQQLCDHKTHDGQHMAAVLGGDTNEDFPSPCPAGVLAEDIDLEAQTSPTCSRLCPAGRFLLSLTIVASLLASLNDRMGAIVLF